MKKTMIRFGELSGQKFNYNNFSAESDKIVLDSTNQHSTSRWSDQNIVRKEA